VRQIDDGLRACPIGDPESEMYDPDACPGSTCEVERDGDHEYWECEECGYAFGHRLAEETGGLRISSADSCQAGIPEEVRRRASPPAQGPAQLIAGSTIPTRSHEDRGSLGGRQVPLA
jgi:hypothetical protein